MWASRLRRALLSGALLLFGAVAPAAAQSWTAPRTWTTGELVTSSIMNTHIRDNELVLRAGGFSVTSQAIGDLLCASSTTQFARLADVATGQILASGGVGACPAYTGTLTVTGTGTHTIGGGGAGTNSQLIINGANASAAGPYVQFQKNGTNLALVGAASAILGGTSSDLILYTYSSNGIRFHTNDSGTLKMQLTTTGVLNLPLTGITHTVGNGTDNTAVATSWQNSTATLNIGVDNNAAATYGVGNSAALVYTNTAGGLSLAAINASGAVRVYSGGSTQRWSWTTSGHFTPNGGNTYNIGDSTNTIKDIYVGGVAYIANGTSGAPSLALLNSTTTGFYRQAADTIGWTGAGTLSATFTPLSANEGASIQIQGFAVGTGTKRGPYFTVGRNSSGNGAPGTYGMRDKSDVFWAIWTDSSGNLRIAGSQPTETGGDTIGTVVGTQTSQRATKNIYGRYTDYAGALRTLLQTPIFEFEYKSGAYNHQRFVGITTDDSPIFGMDRGKSFNPVTAFGYTVAAFKAQQQEIDRLAARVRALEGRR